MSSEVGSSSHSPLANDDETCAVALLFMTIALIIAQMLDIFNTTDVVCRQVNFSFKREQPSMIRAILSSLHPAMPCRPHQELGRVVAVLAWMGSYPFDGKSVSPFCGRNVGVAALSSIFERLNLDQPIASGRCRVTLTPT
jgi:hypothetical protein